MVWFIAAVETQIPWPDKDYEVVFNGRKVSLRTATPNRMPAICIEYGPPAGPTNQMQQMHMFTREFMSALCWVFPYTLTEVTAIEASRCMDIGPGPRHLSTGMGFFINYLPETMNTDAKLGLAFYREAISINSVFYSFLSYWKIISLLHNDGSTDQQQWLEKVLGLLAEPVARQRLRDPLI